MDVRCGRCGTEYEFDDALISERGTTVKCTNCGYQFKVYPPRSRGQTPEQWIVRTVTGEELIFTSIRDLQRSISQQRIGPDDVLSRGVEPPRPLSAIAELQPFLHSRPEPSHKVPRTLFGVAPPANASRGGVGPPSGQHAQIPTGTTRPGGADAAPQPESFRQQRETPALGSAGAVASTTDEVLRGHPGSSSATSDTGRPSQGGMGSTQVMPPSRDRGSDDVSRTHPATPGAMRTSEQVAFAATVGPADGASDDARATVEPPTVPRTYRSGGEQGRGTIPIDSDAPPGDAPFEPEPEQSKAIDETRGLPFRLDDETDPHYSQAPPRRRARSRWVVLVVVLGAGGLVAATVGRRYIEKYTTRTAEVAAKSDPRVEQFLVAGRRLMAEGDLEGAKEELTKASALAASDPQVLSALAGLEATRADLLWLKLRLLDPADKEFVERTHHELGIAVGRAERAVKKAMPTASKDPTVLRARIDVERMKRNLDGARALIEPVAKNASLPENAYVLAALDLAETAPAWSSVLHRLRTAASAEGDVGRARAALIYGLARSGQVSEAELELEKLTKASPAHPLLIELKAFVGRYEAAVKDAGGDGGGEVAAVDPNALPSLDTSEDTEPVGASEGGAGDFRSQLVAAESALRAGNLAEADRLYRAVLSKHPGNTEALAGLGDVAAKRNDPKGAAAMYDKVLEKNPSYLPALVASADQKWAGGDRRGAVALYRRIASQAGAGSSYAAKAQQRISEFERSEGASAPGPAPVRTATPAPEPAPEAPAADDTPHIDTTDLPEFSQ